MTNDEITRMANQIWMAGDTYIGPRIDNLARFAAMVDAAARAEEREACAKVAAEPQGWPLPSFKHAPSGRIIGRIEGEKEMSYRIAAAIRARGQQ